MYGFGMFLATNGIVNSGSSYSTRTQAFATATGITDATILNALNTFDLGLISNGLDSKIKVLYPFVGGTSITCSYNFMNTASNQITWYGGWTYSSNGITPNGTNAYGDCNFNIATTSSSLTPQNNSVSFYSRTDSQAGYDVHGAATANQLGIIARYTNGKAYYLVDSSYTPNVTNSSGTGFYLGTATSSTTKLFKNGTSIVTGTTSQTSFSGVSGPLKIATGDSTYGNKQCAFIHAGFGFSDSEASTFYTLVQTLQTSLSRNV